MIALNAYAELLRLAPRDWREMLNGDMQTSLLSTEFHDISQSRRALPFFCFGFFW